MHPHRNKSDFCSRLDRADDTRMTRAHPVSVVSSFRKDDNPLAVLYQSDDVPDGIPACQRSFPVQRDTSKAPYKPSGQRMDEQLVFRDVIQGPGTCQAQERDILPALVLAELHKRTFGRKTFHALNHDFEERG